MCSWGEERWRLGWGAQGLNGRDEEKIVQAMHLRCKENACARHIFTWPYKTVSFSHFGHVTILKIITISSQRQFLEQCLGITQPFFKIIFTVLYQWFYLEQTWKRQSTFQVSMYFFLVRVQVKDTLEQVFFLTTWSLLGWIFVKTHLAPDQGDVYPCALKNMVRTV